MTHVSESAPLLLKQWRLFNACQSVDSQFIRSVTLEGWRRCCELGIIPQHLEYVFLTDEDLRQRRAANSSLIKAALPHLEYLSLVLSHRSHVIALADAEGWILEMKEQPENAFGGRSTGICVGSSWNEKHIGNNGVGTALATGQPTLVYGIEHYAIQFHSAYCLGVPIRARGQIVGCLDISVTRAEDADPAHLSLAQASVASIETTLGQWLDWDHKLKNLEKFAELGSSLATTIHDLRNPLNEIASLSQIGSLTAKEPHERQYFQDILKSTDSIVEILRSLDEPSNPIVTSPTAVLRECIEEIRWRCKEQGVNVELCVDGADGARVLLHPPLFKRAVQNLLTNALQAMPDGGWVHVEAKATDSALKIEIQDTGKGIAPALQAKIFERFVSSRSGGSGLGLYMVNQTIVRDHHGRLWFESRLGRGTTFFIELPIHRQSALP